MCASLDLLSSTKIAWVTNLDITHIMSEKKSSSLLIGHFQKVPLADSTLQNLMDEIINPVPRTKDYENGQTYPC